MAHRFEITQDLEVGATPEQVWEAIATGRGMDSWFMGQSEVEPREGGRARWSIGGYTEDSVVSTWDPPRRFVNTGTEGPDRVLPQIRLPDRGSRLGSDHDPIRAQRHVGRGLGGGVRSDE